MISDWLLYAGLLFTFASAFLIVHTLFTTKEGGPVLTWASQDRPTTSDNKLIELSRPLVHQLTLKYAQRVKSPSYRKKTEFRILTGGLESVLNTDEFIGMQFLWGVLLPAVLILLNFALSLGYPIPLLLLTVPVGFYLPIFYAASEKKLRYTSIITDLPFYIDLLALSVEAGMDFVGSLKRIVDKSNGSPLAQEFEKVLRDIQLGSTRSQAMKDMAYRLDIPEVSSFVNVLVDADATGASISQVLKEQSNQMRLERFVRAEKAGARASQAILIPLVLFILPAVFIMVFAPLALQFMYGD
jgi:tight adherence protein C